MFIHLHVRFPFCMVYEYVRTYVHVYSTWNSGSVQASVCSETVPLVVFVVRETVSVSVPKDSTFVAFGKKIRTHCLYCTYCGLWLLLTPHSITGSGSVWVQCKPSFTAPFSRYANVQCTMYMYKSYMCAQCVCTLYMYIHTCSSMYSIRVTCTCKLCM